MSSPIPVTHLDPAVLASYLERTRWFGGKGRAFDVGPVARLTRFQHPPLVDVLLVGVTYADDGSTEQYQVPLAYYAEPEHRLDHAFVGWWEDPELGWVHAYDALHDRDATAHWLRAFGPGEDGPLVFHRLPGHDLDLDAVGSLFTGEQSNSTVLFGEDSVLKLFRKVSPGANPDITVHEALTRAGSEHVAQLYGWVDTDLDGERLDLGLLQQFLRTATDGWDLALASLRALFAEPDVAVREAGGDFAGEAARLGDAVRAVHDLLAAELPHDGGATPAETASGMRRRLAAAVQVAPALAPHQATLEALFDAVAGLPTLPVQRVHGDLHLGQTLRTSLGWKVVDFEGEPAKPLAERERPDSPWRDVAGMLRSFDYAARVAARQAGDAPEDQVADRAEAWAERCRRYFLTAYLGDAATTPTQQLLLDAYLADKAVYEVVYETRNRPTWVDIPLAALERLRGGTEAR